ncbi:MAG: calcium/proton exchanger [Ardenticatenales bacterium]
MADAVRPAGADVMPIRWRLAVYGLLAFVPLAPILERVGVDSAWVFGAAALALVPLSRLVGRANEEVAAYAGARAGGLLTATLAYAPQLVLCTLALAAGRHELVKASITGALLSTLLLVMGLAFFAGGLRHRRQYFNREQAELSATMMVLSVIALAVPALYGTFVPAPRNSGPIESLSEGVAATMLVVYALALYFALFWDDEPSAIAGAPAAAPRWPLRRALATLAAALVGVAWLGSIFVDQIGPLTRDHGVTEMFVGLIIVPLATNVSAHFMGVEMAWRNRADISIAATLGSSIHIALFVAPLLVFLSLLLGHPMDLIFSPLELVALAAASGVATLVAHDGASNWLEGVMLMAVYAMLAMAFWWAPGIR